MFQFFISPYTTNKIYARILTSFIIIYLIANINYV